MYISSKQLVSSLKQLESVHPFYGITFLSCKQVSLPVGKTREFPINKIEEEFLKKYYRPNPRSSYFYRVFRLSEKSKRWLRPDYPSSGSQKSRTTTFKEAFIHELNTDAWGWSNNYLEVLKKHLSQNKLIPAFDLAVWLFQQKDWPSNTVPKDIVKYFLKEFSINDIEKSALFNISIPIDIDVNNLLNNTAITWKDLRLIMGDPQDAQPEEGGALIFLGLNAVGPSKKLIFEPAERLNLITGDNGLGKTFLLECAWWALSGEWAGLTAYPRSDAKSKEPAISFQISGDPSKTDIPYNWGSQSWQYKKSQSSIPGLVIYARVDGSFAVWDPARVPQDRAPSDIKRSISPSVLAHQYFLLSKQLVLTPEQVWDGVEEETRGKTRSISNGLLRDWITWQNKPDRYPFETFKKVLYRLSPRDLGPLEPGDPIRLPFDAREIPTLKHPYGTVPIVHASAGIRRIVAIAYLVVWAWEEHKAHSALIRKEPQKSMVILIDEIEAHLHPQWQRAILPSLLDVFTELDKHLQIQFLVATHSPLITASIETKFDIHTDKLFHLDLSKTDRINDNVILKELPFIKYGRVGSWLMSDVFELKQDRSQDAEEAIEKAKKLQADKQPNKEDVKKATEDLIKTLAGDDPFWPRWIGFASKFGVTL